MAFVASWSSPLECALVCRLKSTGTWRPETPHCMISSLEAAMRSFWPSKCTARTGTWRLRCACICALSIFKIKETITSHTSFLHGMTLVWTTWMCLTPLTQSEDVMYALFHLPGWDIRPFVSRLVHALLPCLAKCHYVRLSNLQPSMCLLYLWCVWLNNI